jgi:DNA-directed RNA polymerase subunit RPC12/RpoP
VRCPHCANKLMQKSGTATRLRIEGPIEIGSDGVAKAKCYWCRAEVELPVELKKAAVPEPGDRILVRARTG